MISTAIIFDHRGRTRKDSEGPLEVRVTVNRKPYYVATGIKVRAKEWKFGLIIDRADADELNRRLHVIANAVEREVTDCIEQMRAVDVAEIRRKVWMVREEMDDSTPFIDWAEEQVRQLDVAAGTRKHYVTTITRLRACNIIRKWPDVTVEKIYAWDSWLHNIPKPLTDAEKKIGAKPKKIGDGAVFTHHRTLKALINRAIKLGLLTGNPYDRLKGEFKRGIKESVEYLTEDEVGAFRALQPEQGSMLDVAHDLFIFQLYTGMSYSDAERFDIRNYKQVDNRWVTVSQRVKTGVPFVSQLLPPVVKVLEKYNWQVPIIGNGEYNQCLKGLGKAAGIQTKMHSHLARHTFATMMLRNGVSIENLARMLGHTKLDQTLRYAKVLAQSVHDDFDMIAKKLNL